MAYLNSNYEPEQGHRSGHQQEQAFLEVLSRIRASPDLSRSQMSLAAPHHLRRAGIPPQPAPRHFGSQVRFHEESVPRGGEHRSSDLRLNQVSMMDGDSMTWSEEEGH